jgi:sugar phosphate isomerase/epimerase
VQYTIAVGALPFYPVGTTLNVARAAAADGVELLVTPSLLRRGAEQYAALALERQLPILSVHALLRYTGAALAQQTAEDCASIAFAAAIPTCEAVVVHPPLTGARPSPDLNRWLNAICAAREDSANPDLMIGLENRPENHDGSGEQLLDDLERLRRLAGEWDLGLTYDMAHAASRGVDVVEAVKLGAPRLVNVHLSDAGERSYRGGIRNGLFRDHRLPGTGSLPLAEVITALQRAGYDGLVTLEPSPASLRAWWPLAPRRLLRDAVADMRSLASGAPASTRTHAEPRFPAR